MEKKDVIIIGGGPAGLAAADQRNKRGHNVNCIKKESGTF